jgi:hypothetical protein
MATLEELVIQLSADTKNLQAEMKSASNILDKSTHEMKKSIEDLSKNGAKSTSFLQQAFATMSGFIGGQAVIGAIQSVRSTLVEMFKDGIKDAIEAQQVFVNFSNSLIRIGKYTSESANEFKEFAESIEHTTGVTAEAVLKTGGLIANLTNLSGNALKESTQALVDYSSAMGIDVESAVKKFTMSVNSGRNAFRELGITFDENSTKAERTAIVIDAINNKFAGAAAASAKTYSGALKILTNSFGTFKEEMANSIVENQAVTTFLGELSKVFNDLAKGLGGNSQEMRMFIADALKAVLNFGVTAIEVVEWVKPVWDGLAHIFKQVSASIASAIILATQGFNAYIEANKRLEAELSEDWNSIGKKSESLNIVKERLDSMAISVGAASNEVANGATVTDGALQKTVGTVNTMTSSLTAAQEALKAWAAELAALADTNAGIYSLELSALQTNLDAKLISEEQYLAEKERLLMQNIINEQAMLDSAAEQGLIKGDQLTQARIALAMKQSQAEIATYAEKVKRQESLDKEREANFKSSLSTISSLASSGNKELAAIGKAAAITQAVIDGYAAVQKALASAPPPFNFGLAAAVGAATVANVSKIKATPLQTGIDEIPGIGIRDNFPAMLAPGERVVPRETNQDLSRFLESQANQPRAQINVNVMMNDVFTSDPREMGLKLIETINEAAQANGIQLIGSTIR